MTDATMSADLVVVGGGLGGVAAALTASRLGQTVIMATEFQCLGGQMTSQGVPPDEHPWVEMPMTSPSYQDLRNRIRDHYRRNYPLAASARKDPTLNPGDGFVSALCHEPRVAAVVFEEMVSAAVAGGRLSILRGYRPVRASRRGATVTSVTVRGSDSGHEVDLTGTIVVDATELGDLLELAGVPFALGAEARSETGELHAPIAPDPMDQQAITWCFAVEYRHGEDHTIPRPPRYEYWRDRHDERWPGPQFSWTDVDPITLEPRELPIFRQDPTSMNPEPGFDFWHYRRVLSRANMADEFTGGDVTSVNWPQVDYWELPLLGVDEATAERARAEAKEMSLAFLYWMQTEAPRADGGVGYPELRLRPDVMGSEDGFALEPYIREARRIRARFTVTEAHIGRQMRGDGAGSELFSDSVGLGFYRIDLHPSTSGRNYVDIDCFPFQIPLGCLIPLEVDNFLPAAKNIGTTHITNGAYRLHPVEWSIGEAVGALSAFCGRQRTTPTRVYEDLGAVQQFQRLLTEELGLTLTWPDEIRRTGRPVT
ncbi:MAG TPA: FAD-dependent oxidoreductase [Beutenbergiaceae bacterium]|nr:FAD-dependent oxidoreductase [Beutenbergiaceae bacterium]